MKAQRLCLWPMLVAAMLGMAGTPGVAAAPPIAAVEQAIETSGDRLSLPSGGVGTLAVTPCGTCKPLALLAGATTRWSIGSRSVGFAEWREALASSPRSPVLVLYRHAGTEITRVVVHVQKR